MKLFDKFKKLIACAILVCFIPSQAWSQGILIPSGSSLNLNTGTITVPGNVTNNGTIVATNGTINLTGNWTNAGTLDAGNGTVNFSGVSGTQNLVTGGIAAGDSFGNLGHTGASTVQVLTNHVIINHSFNAIAGTFNTNNFNLTVGGNWSNIAIFNPGTDTVTLDGTGQSMNGTTTFNILTKTVASADTLTFDHTGTQTVTKSLTLVGAASPNLLSLHSDLPPNLPKLHLMLGGLQNISDVSVKYNDAGIPPLGGTDVTLIGRNASVDEAPGGTNINWQFGVGTLTWGGTVSTEWGNPLNWVQGIVPIAGDTVTIPPVGGTVTNDPNLCPPPAGRVNPCAAVSVGNLTLQPSATLTLNGQNLAVTGSFTNKGNLIVEGIETLGFTNDISSTDAGTVTYVGDGTGNPITVSSGAFGYYNLVINDPHIGGSAPNLIDTYKIAAASNLNVAGSLTLTTSSLDLSGGTATVGGNVTIATGTTLKAPSSILSSAFTVGGNWTDNGTFTADSGLVTFNGTNQSVSGSTTFYQFNKTVPGIAGPYTLTFDATSGAFQKFTNKLTLVGNSTNDLFIASSSPGTQADIALGSTGTQLMNFLNVSYLECGWYPCIPRQFITLAKIQLPLMPDIIQIGLFGGDTVTWGWRYFNGLERSDQLGPRVGTCYGRYRHYSWRYGA